MQNQTPLFASLIQELVDQLQVVTGVTESKPTFDVEMLANGGSVIHLRHPSSDLALPLHPKQTVAFNTTATEVLYGGGAGGGKSMLIRVALIAWAHAIQGIQCYLFRRLRADLFKNHMDGSGNFSELLGPWLASGYARINMTTDGGYIRLGRSKIHLCHLQHSKFLNKYQGAEINILAMDELTHFERREYNFLRSRVRLGGLKVPPWAAGNFPRILAGSNPGNIGHTWVRANWIEPQPAFEVWAAATSDGGMRRQFIPALLADNPTMTENDPSYDAKLEGLGSAALVRAMRLGDWNIVAGGFFDDVWSEQVHVLPPFEIPLGWKIDRSFDWGSSKPFSVGWWAESDGATPATMPDGRLRSFPRGTLFRVAEWYGWTGEANEGLRLTDSEIARGILEREAQLPELRGRVVRAGPADSAIFDLHPREVNGFKMEVSVAKEFESHGVKFVPAQKGPGSRVQGWSRVRQMLKASMTEMMEDPGLFIFSTCRQFIRTVPVLPRDERNPEDVDSSAEDHCADEVRYRCFAVQFGTPKSRANSRPAVSYLPEFLRAW